MKILLYGVNYAPELTGIGKYSGEMAIWLAEQGHEVRVVTAPPYYPEWKVDVAMQTVITKKWWMVCWFTAVHFMCLQNLQG